MFFFSSRRRHTRLVRDWSSDVCSSDLVVRSNDSLTLTADDAMKMTQVEELLKKYLAMRKVELGALDWGEPQAAAGSSLRETVSIKQGIDSDLGRKITKEVKSAKMKVQMAIQGNELRVTGKKRDDQIGRASCRERV